MNKIWPKLKEVLIFLGTIVIYYLSSYLGIYLLNGYIKSNNFIISNISAIISSLIPLAILLFLFRKRLIKDFKSFKKENLGIGIRYWLCGVLIMIVGNYVISIITGGIAQNESLNREMINAYPLYSLVTCILIAPISEEITFRLAPRNIFRNKILYALLCGLVFGYAHVYGTGLAGLLYIIPYGALGYTLALAVYKTNNIFTSIGLHMLHNSITILLLIITGQVF